MGSAVCTVVWLEVTEEDRAALQELGCSYGVRLLQADSKSLESKVVAARARGAVVAIVSSHDEAGRAFRAGADSVLRAGDATSDRLESAIEQATQTASARLKKAVEESGVDLEPTAFSLLMRALCRQIGDSLTTAWSQYETIAQRIEDVRELNTKLTEWAAVAAPPQEFRQLRSRATVLLSQDVQQMLQNAAGSLHRADAALENAQLLSTGGRDAPTDVNVVLEELVELLRYEVKAWADLRVRASEKCMARIPVPFLVCLVTAIIGFMVDAFRSASQWDGRIEIRAWMDDGILVLELQDNGPPLMEDLDSASHAGATRGGQLARIRERVRALGAEMLVESSETCSVVRVYLNANDTCVGEAPSELVSAAVESTTHPDTRLRPKN